VVLPPLQERMEDIRPLASHFIAKYADERHGVSPVVRMDKEVERLFFEYSWPGNVRELENVIERAMVMCPGDTIRVDDLPKDFRKNISMDSALRLDDLPAQATLYEALAYVEKQMILHALQKADYVQAHAAALLGIGKSGLNQKLKKYNIDVADYQE
jgi:two-component system NtrC family response regulator